MFSLRRPDDETLRRLLADQARRSFSYPDVGVTRGERSTRLPRSLHRIRLGTGEATYVAALAALETWAMYGLRWTEVFPPDAPVREGAVFATVVRHLGFWSANPCRVVYRESTEGEVASASFAIGTLPGHAERGEERFRVERRDDDSVWFEILAFAEPRHWLARLGAPVVRRLQHRFCVQALAAVREAVVREVRRLDSGS